MDKIIYAIKDLSKNYFNWHGRLSRTGYMWSWAGILAVSMSLLFIAAGLFVGAFIAIAFVFAGGYMITAEADVKMSRLLGLVVLSGFLFLTGIGLGVLNLINIFRQSDPNENKYGKPIPSNPTERV